MDTPSPASLLEAIGWILVGTLATSYECNIHSDTKQSACSSCPVLLPLSWGVGHLLPIQCLLEPSWCGLAFYWMPVSGWVVSRG